jgi:hypothetical protein
VAEVRNRTSTTRLLLSLLLRIGFTVAAGVVLYLAIWNPGKLVRYSSGSHFDTPSRVGWFARSVSIIGGTAGIAIGAYLTTRILGRLWIQVRIPRGENRRT